MFSLLLTLYVVPVVYGYVARNTRSPEYIAHLIDKLRGEKKPAPEVGLKPRRAIKKPAGGDTLPALVPSVRFRTERSRRRTSNKTEDRRYKFPSRQNKLFVSRQQQTPSIYPAIVNKN